MSKQKNNNNNLRKSKMMEFINKNSAIMPPNDYDISKKYF